MTHGEGPRGTRGNENSDAKGADFQEADCNCLAIEMLDTVLGIIAKIESDASMFPLENSAEVSVCDFSWALVAEAPAHLQPAIQASIGKFVATAPRHVFVPRWMRDGRF